MANRTNYHDESAEPLRRKDATSPSISPHSSDPRRSASTASTTSLVLDHLSSKAPHQKPNNKKDTYYSETNTGHPDEEFTVEDQIAWKRQTRGADKRWRRIIWFLAGAAVLGWIVALFLFVAQDRHVSHAARPHDPHATQTVGSGRKVELEQVLTGEWFPKSHSLAWIAGPDGEDGLLLERGGAEGRDYLVVEDVRFRGESLDVQKKHSTTLMRAGRFEVGGRVVTPDATMVSPDHATVLVMSDAEKNWRHSSTGLFWLFDVESQTGKPLDPAKPDGRMQLASWSPLGDAVVFTRENDMFLRRLGEDNVTRITEDGGKNLFYGIPDWVYEEEVFAGASATWWSGDGKFVAFLRTDESAVPEFPVQYYFSRPSGKKAKDGEENYPEVSRIKYPKAGAPMSVVSLQLYDVEEGEMFTVPIEGDFKDDDRLITEVLWAGKTGKVIVRETNRESDVLKVILIDAVKREGRTVRETDVSKIDGGWFEVSHSTTYVEADPSNKRPDDGYIDTVIHEGYDHLAYFSPLDSDTPKMLTEGKWEVVDAPSAVDPLHNMIYFVGTKDGSMQRHVYTVSLVNGPESVKAITDTREVGYYAASFSANSDFMLLTYEGPGIPWQEVRATPTNRIEWLTLSLETNEELRALAQKTELPIEKYETITVDGGFELNLVERRPPHFNPKNEYPVLFYLYNGPGFQHVDRKFTIDFQSYVASALGYIVVTVDGRGTGYKGREHRCIIRGNIGHYEALDQIAAAKIWQQKSYIDPSRLAIWGWSYGGFMTLKTLETDAGNTFNYGMAVAPVTDWRFYDSIYTERYMHTPQHNPSGYDNATVSDMQALGNNTRFLVMHGYSDDNVHFQNTLQLLDRLDVANVMNYDVHVFPDSDHSIFFHNGNRVVYEKLRDWLVNAFNGEWERIASPTPKALVDVR
ncbi:hypothetical protein MBLNU230_g6228t1 [Neophaeotheca triangularis]